MKKIAILGLTTLIVLSIGSYTYLTSKNEGSIDKKEKQIKSTNMLTMMLETEAGSGSYKEVTQSEWPTDGYEFNEVLSKCENGGIVNWDNDTKKIIMKSNKSDKCYIYFDVKKESFVDYIINNVYKEDGLNGLYYHDGQGTYTNANQEAGDNSYRYSGANPNNYVCFGSDETTCSNDNLYRIIGLFDDDSDGVYNIKLIKYDYTTIEMLGTDGSYKGSYDGDRYYKGNMYLTDISVYSWSGNESNDGSNDWSTSDFNKINLNINYLNYLKNINNKWVDMIEQTIWYLGAVDDSHNKAKEFYNSERSTSVDGNNPPTYKDEIGLMYPSDYGFSSNPDNWSKDLDEYQSNNWLFMGLDEWTITHSLYYDDNTGVFYLRHMNDLGFYVVSLKYAARPCFYLKSNVIINNGTGSASDPFRISL